MESIIAILEKIGNAVSLLLDFTSILCIAIGFISVLRLLGNLKETKISPVHKQVRLKFGGWLAVALEYQLGSDIVKTTVSPTYTNLIQLGALAVIRTFLNYFLNKELKEEMELPAKQSESLRMSSPKEIILEQ